MKDTLVGPDTSDDCLRDDDPRPNGKIYDIDTPGISNASLFGYPGGWKAFYRFNVATHATFNTVRCSDDKLWFAGVTGEKANEYSTAWIFLTRPGHPTDNSAVNGPTTMSKD